MANTIEVADLPKHYGDVRAVDGVSFQVAEGDFFGILGPNGADKTTALEVVEGPREPDSGTVTVLGVRSWPRNPRLLPRIGVPLQGSSFFERITAREQIRTFASLYGVPHAQADHWLAVVGLVDAAGQPNERLSGGAATAPLDRLRARPQPGPWCSWTSPHRASSTSCLSGCSGGVSDGVSAVISGPGGMVSGWVVSALILRT